MNNFENLLPKLPKLNEISTLPNINFSDFEVRNYQHADYQYEIIMEAIEDFQKTLDDTQEVAVQLASFGQTVMMQVTKIGYSNPSIIHFYGYVNGKDSELIQHVSQLSFLLTSVPKLDPEKPARRIGFTND